MLKLPMWSFTNVLHDKYLAWIMLESDEAEPEGTRIG